MEPIIGRTASYDPDISECFAGKIGSPRNPVFDALRTGIVCGSSQSNIPECRAKFRQPTGRFLQRLLRLERVGNTTPPGRAWHELGNTHRTGAADCFRIKIALLPNKPRKEASGKPVSAGCGFKHSTIAGRWVGSFGLNTSRRLGTQFLRVLFRRGIVFGLLPLALINPRTARSRDHQHQDETGRRHAAERDAMGHLPVMTSGSLQGQTAVCEFDLSVIRIRNRDQTCNPP